MSGDRALRDRVAIVTGASGGIGRAACVALAAAGARVLAAGRDPRAVAATVEACASGRGPEGDAIGLSGIDVRDPAALDRMAATALERFGRIDILVTAAGASRAGLPYPVAALRTATWDETIDTNLKGVFLANRAVLPAMMRQRSGEIINISSARGATRGRPNAAAYCASKFGVMGLSEALAEEVRPYGIRVQVLLPDAVDTALIAGTSLAPQGALPPERIGRLIVDLVRLPPDTRLLHPLVAPFSTSSLEAAS